MKNVILLILSLFLVQCSPESLSPHKGGKDPHYGDDGGVNLPDGAEPPIQITEGGVYSGYWVSDDDAIPAVSIQTAEPVIIESSIVEGPGDLIQLKAKNAHITIRNVRGIGQSPKRSGQLRGRFFNSGSQSQFRSLIIEHCHLIGTTGIRIRDTQGATIKIRYNYAEHIDGRFSDGKGGTLDKNLTSRDTRQFVIMRKCSKLRDTEIAWNRVINVDIPGDFYQNYTGTKGEALGQQEDLFNFNSSGVLGDSIRVHHNLAVGAFSYAPASKRKYTGGGYIADGGDCGYLVFNDNYAIGLQNYSFSVATNDAVVFRENVAVSSGILPDGQTMGYGSIGLSHQLNKSPGSRLVNNRVAYVNTRPNQARKRKDSNLKNCGSGNCTGNISLWPGQLIDRDKELEMIREWDEKVRKAGIKIGLSADL